LGKDFNIAKASGYMNSTTYSLVVNSPLGKCSNYSDLWFQRGLTRGTRYLLVWFAKETGNSMYLNRDLVYTQTIRAIEKNQMPVLSE
jgi:hypothetical protein